MRTTTRLLVTLGVLALTVPAAAQSELPNPGNPGAFHRGGPDGPRWGHREMHAVARPVITLMLRNRDALGLAPEQVQRLEQLRADFLRDAIRRGADLRIAEVDLMMLRQAEPADLAQIEPKLREIERLRTDLRLARIRTVEDAKSQLTPEQRAKLRTLLAEQPGPRRGRHPTGSREPEARTL